MLSPRKRLFCIFLFLVSFVFAYTSQGFGLATPGWHSEDRSSSRARRLRDDGVIWKHFAEQSETWHKTYDVKIPPGVIMALYAGALVLLGIILICFIATSNCNPIRRSSPEPCHTSQLRADQYRLIEESQSRSSTLDRR
ncbi:unnamed protein product, partial [Mesorhabditis spiculigera]